jgi:hypothetical protein
VLDHLSLFALLLMSWEKSSLRLQLPVVKVRTSRENKSLGSVSTTTSELSDTLLWKKSPTQTKRIDKVVELDGHEYFESEKEHKILHRRDEC